MTRTALILACLAALSGCAEAGLVFVGANMATIIHADKTIPDFAISAETEKNCSLLHATRNEPYCQAAPADPRAVLAATAASHHCYRTLGGISCYPRPDYMASGQTRLDFTAGYLEPAAGSAAGSAPGPLAQAWAAPPVEGAGGPRPSVALPPLAPLPGSGTY